MDNNYFWNIIVDSYQQNINAQESIVQNIWESFFVELFDYKKIFNEIESHRNLYMGSTSKVIPDIYLRQNGTDVVDVELKRFNLPLTDSMVKQLISYMSISHISIGLIICNKIHIFHYDYNKQKILSTSIDFVKDNPDGCRFIDLFKKASFSADNIQNFIISKNAFSNHVDDICNLLTPTYIRDVVTRALSIDFSIDEINSALDKVNFSIQNKNEHISKIVKINSPRPIKPIPHTNTTELTVCPANVKLCFQSKTFCAYGMKYANGSFVVFAGSSISDKTTPSCGNNIAEMRDELIMTEGLVLRNDIIFTSSSAAAKFVAGSSRSGNACWFQVE